MSYGNGPQSPRRKVAAGGSGFVFFVILAIGAFVIFSNLGDQGRSGNGNQSPNSTEERSSYGQPEYSPSAPDKSTNGDWSMEQVQTDPAEKSVSQPESKKTTKGDWSIEEVDTDKSKEGDFGLRLSDDNGNASDAPKNKSTESGDWKLEEVDKSKKSTEKGDWKMEEVDDGKKGDRQPSS